MVISKVHFKQNLSLAWPMALNSILVQSMVIVDLLLVAPLGEISVAALGIAAAIVAFLMGIQNALGNGTQMVIARAVGAGHHQKISSDLASGLLINMAFSLVAFALLMLTAKPLLGFISDNGVVTAQAASYIGVSIFTILFSSLTQVLIVYFNANRKTQIPLYGFMIEVPCNVVFSLVLIHGHFGLTPMGLKGAAMGSFLAMLIRLAYLVIQIRKEPSLDLKQGFKSIDRQGMRGHVHEVWPIAANFVTLMGGMTMFQMLYAQLEVYAYAAITLVFPWMRIGAQFVTAWAHATAINISQVIGKNERTQLPDLVSAAVTIIMVLSGIMVVGFLGFSLMIPSIYPEMGPQTLQAMAMIAPIYIALPVARSYNTLCGHSLRAMGDSLLVLRVHATTQWVIALPLCALAIYLNAPIYIVFGVILLEELLKVIPFRMQLKHRLNSFRSVASA
jgi:putative MATE family efflux protein